MSAIKKAAYFLGRALAYKHSLRGLLVREFVKKFEIGSYEMRLEQSLVTRPQYGWCLLNAARLAKKLGHSKVSAIEFGVAGGRGLVDAEWHAAHIEQITGVKIEIYGFDAETGLPDPVDYRDLPYCLKGGYFVMDRAKLEARLTRSKLVIGDVAHTVDTFAATFDPAPIGAIFLDLDYYSASKQALRLFDVARERFLPRAFMYADDLWWWEELYCDFNGEALAISEFNAEHDRQKLAPAKWLSSSPRAEYWHHKVMVYHDFTHRNYCRYVGLEAPQQIPLR